MRATSYMRTELKNLKKKKSPFVQRIVNLLPEVAFSLACSTATGRLRVIHAELLNQQFRQACRRADLEIFQRLVTKL